MITAPLPAPGAQNGESHARRPRAPRALAWHEQRHQHQRNTTSRVHAAALAKGDLRLGREIARRQASERAVASGKGEYHRLLLASQAMQKKLRELARQFMQAQEDERETISRELHDEVVQMLIGINMRLSALAKSAAPGQHNLKREIVAAQRLVEHSVKAVHQFARDLRPAVLDDLGLIPALQAFCRSVAAPAKVKIRLTAFAGVEALASTKRLVLYRVAQEALTNVVRHADSTRVVISLRESAGMVRMEISDNGKSFPVESTLAAKSRRRLGLLAMKERIEMVGGRLSVDSAPGQGTTVCAEIPLARARSSK